MSAADNEDLVVHFLSAETLNNMLDDWGVDVELVGGGEVSGIWRKAYPQDGSQTMAEILDYMTDKVIIRIDLRNFTKITVL